MSVVSVVQSGSSNTVTHGPHSGSTTTPSDVWSTIQKSRRIKLTELLSRNKDEQKLALNSFKEYLSALNDCLTSFVQSRHTLSGFCARYSDVFEQLKTSHLESERGKMLVAEYGTLSHPHPHDTNHWRTTLENFRDLSLETSHLQKQVIARLNADIETNKAKLVSLLDDRAPLVALVRHVGRKQRSDIELLREIHHELSVLAEGVKPLKAHESIPAQLLVSLRTLQEDFQVVSERIESRVVCIPRIRALVKQYAPDLPPAPFGREDTVAALPSPWQSEHEKIAYLLIARHLDTLDVTYPEFAEQAMIERDSYLERLIQELDVHDAHNVIFKQASHFSESTPELSSSLNSLISEASTRLAERALELAIASRIPEELARCVARAPLSVEERNQICAMLEQETNLHPVLTKIVANYHEIPLESLDEFTEYLKILKAIVTELGRISPILSYAFPCAADDSPHTSQGLVKYLGHIRSMEGNAQELFKTERAVLIELAASTLKQNRPVYEQADEQYRLAAVILIVGFMPEQERLGLKRVARTCKSISRALSRAQFEELSFALVNETIRSLLIPDILTIRNGGKENPQLVEYQIRHDRTSAWSRIVEYLDLLAQHTPIKKQNAPISVPRPTLVKESPKKKEKTPEIQPSEDAVRHRLEKKLELMQSVSQVLTQFELVLERLNERLEEKREQLVPLVECFKNMNALAMRLASSLSSGMGVSERSQYRTGIERNSFNSLCKIVGVEATGITSKASRAKAKKITTTQIVDIISKQAIAEYGRADAMLEDARLMSESCSAVIDALRPKVLSESTASPDRMRSWIDTHWPMYSGRNHPQSTLLLKYHALLSEPTIVEDIKKLIGELRGELVANQVTVDKSLSEIAQSTIPDEAPRVEREVI